MFHIGHLNILKHAREQCDFLIVGVSTDEVVRNYKHKNPIIPFAERATIVESCKYTDYVVPQISMNKSDVLDILPFNVMFHGDEWKGTALYNAYELEFASHGKRIVYLPHTEGISSTILRSKVL